MLMGEPHNEQIWDNIYERTNYLNKYNLDTVEANTVKGNLPNGSHLFDNDDIDDRLDDPSEDLTSDVTKYLGYLHDNKLLNDEVTIRDVYSNARKFDFSSVSDNLNDIVDIEESEDNVVNVSDSYRAEVDVRNILPEGQKRVRFAV